jgi:hypothetical protein
MGLSIQALREFRPRMRSMAAQQLPSLRRPLEAIAISSCFGSRILFLVVPSELFYARVSFVP